MNGRGDRERSFLGNPMVAGAVLIILGLALGALSYNANEGLPFVPTYVVSVEVKDAAELVEGSSEVRLGGARVGLVTGVEAVPGKDDKEPLARLTLTLDQTAGPLPSDSEVRVRTRSLLGAKYLDLVPGDSTETVPQGGTIELGHLERPVELDEAIEIFDRRTTRALQGSLTGLGDGLAGRGTALNDTLGSLRRASGPLDRVTRVLADPDTDLDGFVRGLDSVTAALHPVAPSLGSLIDGAATTATAIEAAGTAVDETLAQLSPTERRATRALNVLAPVLGDAAAVARDIRPGTELLPEASESLARAIEKTTPVLADTPPVADELALTFESLSDLSADPETPLLLRALRTTVVSLGRTLDVLGPAQIHCNVAGIWARNVPSFVSQGNRDGTWLNVVAMLHLEQMLQASEPEPELHYNPYPREDATECEAGNEGFEPGVQIGNPERVQNGKVPQTSPPPGVTELAQEAGLVEGGDK